MLFDSLIFALHMLHLSYMLSSSRLSCFCFIVHSRVGQTNLPLTLHVTLTKSWLYNRLTICTPYPQNAIASMHGGLGHTMLFLMSMVIAVRERMFIYAFEIAEDLLQTSVYRMIFTRVWWREG